MSHLSKPLAKKNNPSPLKSFLALVKKDFLAYSPLSYKGSLKKYFLKMFFILLLFGGLFIFYRYIINAYQLANFKVIEVLLPFFLLLYLAISTVQIAFSNQSITFLIKDESLQVMPIRPSVIYLARIMAKLINEVLKIILFLLPFLIALASSSFYQLFLGAKPLYYLRALMVLVLIPLLAVLMGIIFQPLLVYARTLIRRYNILLILLFLFLSGLAIGFFTFFITKMQDNYGFIRTDVIKKRWHAYDLKLATFIYDSMLIKYLASFLLVGAKRSLLNVSLSTPLQLLMLSGIMLLLVFLAMIVIYFTYYDLINLSKPRGLKRQKYNLFTHLKRPFSLYLTKELLTLWRHKELFRRQISYYFVIPVIIYLVNATLAKLDLNYYGVRLAVIINVVLNLLLLCFANIIAAMSFSLDSNFFSHLRTQAKALDSYVWGKLLLGFINLLLLNLISFGIILKFNPFQRYLKSAPYLILLISFIYSLIHLLIVFGRDLKQYQKHLYFSLDDNTANHNVIVWGVAISALTLTGHFLFGFGKIILAQWVLVAFGGALLVLLLGQIIIYLQLALKYPEDYLDE